jgi:hypothetical protein
MIASFKELSGRFCMGRVRLAISPLHRGTSSAARGRGFRAYRLSSLIIHHYMQGLAFLVFGMPPPEGESLVSTIIKSPGRLVLPNIWLLGRYANALSPPPSSREKKAPPVGTRQGRYSLFSSPGHCWGPVIRQGWLYPLRV